MGAYRLSLLVFSLLTVYSVARCCRLSNAHTTLMGALSLAFFVGQAWDRPRTTYPFISWSMYGHSAVPPAYHEVIVTTAHGEHEYPFYIVNSSSGPLRGYSALDPVKWRVVQEILNCGCDRDDPKLDSLLASLASVYSMEFGHAVRSVKVVFTTTTRLGEPRKRSERYSWASSTRE